jgi:uncharacterized membrane protein YdbT with pleckstrin-like domain
MSYVNRVLQPGEQVRFKSTVHWIIYFPVLIWLVAGTAGVAMAVGAGGNIAGTIVAVAGYALAFVSFVASWLRRASTEIAVTDRRIIAKRGLIARHTIEMNMDKVESVDVDQSVLGRIFGYGTVLVHGTGADIEPLVKIDSPIEFRNQVTAR